MEEGALGVCAVALAPSLLHSIKFELSVVPILVGSNILGKLQMEKKKKEKNQCVCQIDLYKNNKQTKKNKKRTKKEQKKNKQRTKKEQEQEQPITHLAHVL